MSKKRKKKKREMEHMSESWLLPYSDLLTLLLALFIVLFASSSMDEGRFQQMSAVFSEIFESGSGIMSESAPTNVPVPDDSVGEQNENSSYLEDQQSLGEMQDDLDEYIAVNELESQFDTELTNEGLLLTIRDSVLFNSGEATINPEYMGLANDISQLLTLDRPRQVIITGHTDDIPINNAQYSSNWELSVMRAVKFLKIIVESNEVDPNLFSAKGYGEYKPIVPNDTAENRSKNRRVEVLIQPLVLEDGTNVTPQ
ncbi:MULTISPECIES: flagellar motor protein MotB [Sporosarcina]|uniref:Chemotaxis protein MotB n=2 Tax=Sporosarcina newyorkensis TaxID=759851 RepID=A0A1T4YSH7_9BACL|nr:MULTISPECIES: flagellar motor protein MotB [Sporosarcina]EGQ26161.1 chemotaxis protein MotB [Sporosarcina newyorkensis 2681]MBY0223069.1 flagellar motor protein MotB [Sporosarcina aquimarina]SKB04231.1 chemotaxis protein MotB [Sporosarcina newyorkensis]